MENVDMMDGNRISNTISAQRSWKVEQAPWMSTLNTKYETFLGL